MRDIRTSLRLDAVASGALGALLIVLSGVLDDPLGLPTALSIVVGALLLVWAGFVAWVAGRVSARLVQEVALLNLGYVVLSVVFAFSGWVALTGMGVAFVLVQAGAVLGLTALQGGGLRDLRSASPAVTA
ncbi:hypothetical protein [Intrasporangium sp.]|uniref:hypothetical protein n=1 Tax=Intrasporangium sp. TaxID=1925024 RepID=UPI00293B8580|nr:hypothetical protein [Intrasporangium sp.]MDV3223452.1 hypothetical protein [Intrasporangium sp.]